MSKIPTISLAIVHDIEREISLRLDCIGILYRIFGRLKTPSSIEQKISRKNYSIEQKKLQDLIGIRVVVYFDDDVEICINIIKSYFVFVSETVDEELSDVFRPMRKNLIFKIPENLENQFCIKRTFCDIPIDDTFEIQFRTVLSEGWHEVEHDLRYKNLSAWTKHPESSRVLNGIFATLTTCDWAMRRLFEDLAHAHYVEKDWIYMCMCHFRVHVSDSRDELDILQQKLNVNPSLCKRLLRYDRNTLLENYSKYFKNIPCKLTNIVYIIIGMTAESEIMLDEIPILIRDILQKENLICNPSVE